MSLIVFLAIIGAALLHASWNAMVKGSDDKLTSMAAVVFGHAPFAVLALAFVPLPAVASLPYLFAGIGLHFGYQIFLLQSYKLGDLTQVYPIARGSAPLIVAAISVAILGVTLSVSELLAIALIGIGIISLTLVRRADGQRNAKAAFMALTTGGFIASYSLIDGLGARVSGTSLGFFAWLALGNSLLMALYIAARSPGTFRAVFTRGRKIFLIGGSASFIAYALITWAFTQAPIAVVTALRETSIIFALFIGVFFLKERLDLAKLLSTMLTLIGAALLRYAR
ncbi:DMT family transporter [Roseovarius sp. EL26]|uniref:DMT family transporter n=1 Tax=Roseovarius sp. EL26 TaxID=2126672 RepID=UPI000EA384C2|nr:DMT family transporter [Roseovarius sp. EL26]